MPIHNFKNHELFYQVYQDGNTALLFIHGLGGDGNVWKYQIEHFNSKYSIITVDLFGHGQSSKDVDPVFAPRIDAEAIDSLMGGEIRRPYFVIGHSYAGNILPEMMKSYDPNLKGVVFVDCAYQGFEEVIEARVNSADLMLAMSDEELRNETEKSYVEMIATKPQEEDKELILSSLKYCSCRWLFQSVAGWRAFNSKHPVAKTPIRDDLPILIMEAEYGVGDDFKKSWVNYFKNAKYYLFEDAYHFFFVTEHIEFNSLLEEFIAKTTQS